MQLSFSVLPGAYAITRLGPDASIPGWADGPGLVGVTRAEDELSVVCLADRAPDFADKGWRALRVDTIAALDAPGVVMAAITPISAAGLGVFVMSTHLRDYILVRRGELDRVKDLLRAAGHTVA